MSAHQRLGEGTPKLNPGPPGGGLSVRLAPLPQEKNTKHAKLPNTKPRNTDGFPGKRKLARKRTMNIGTWNVQGIRTKYNEVMEEVKKYNLDITVLTETKKKGVGSEMMGDYIHIYSGVPKEKRAKCGVSVMINKKLKQDIKSWDQISERLLKIEVTIKGCDIVIIGVYAPTDDTIDCGKEEFYQELTMLLDEIGNRKEIFLIGDFNGRIGSRKSDPVVGQFGEDTENNSGERLIELCQQYSLKITNGFFEHKQIHRFTWVQPTLKRKSIIDYIICRQQSRLCIKDVKVQRGANCGSDHYMLKSEVYFPFRNKTDTNRTDTHTEEVNNMKFNLQSLENDSTKFLFQLRLSQKLVNVKEDTAEEMYTEIKKCLIEAAKEALGEEWKDKKKGGCLWWDENLEKMVADKRSLYNKWLSTKNNSDYQIYRSKDREVKRTVAQAKNYMWQNTCSDINKLRGNTRSREAWKILKTLRTNSNENSRISLIKIEDWEKYYEKLLTENRTEFMRQKDTIEQTHEVAITDYIEEDEIAQALRNMKNGKSPGPGGIPIELIKAGTSELKQLLAVMFNKCISGDVIPAEWKEAHICSIHKKGTKTECKNYRGISITSSMSRLFGRVLKQRIEQDLNEIEEQSGFRAGRSCIDNIFSIKQLAEKRTGCNRALHLTFVDLQKAYDSVPLIKLWECLELSGMNRAYISTIKRLYTDTTSKVRIGKHLSQGFRVTKGLRQGCCLAPTLFKLYIDKALNTWRNKCRGMGLTVNNDCIYTLHFADDQVVISADLDDSSYMMRKLQENYKTWGLEINMSKTEHLVVGDTPTDLDLSLENIKACNQYKYLGVLFNNRGTSEDEIKARIGQGRSAIRQLNSVLWSDKVTKSTKRTLYKSLIESIVTYGSEVWEITKSNKQKLKALEMDYWRRCCGVTRLHRIRNEDIRARMEVEDSIVDTIETKRLVWYGHVQRMDDVRWPKKILKWVPPERRKRGRPRRNWRNEVNEAMETRSLQDGDWDDRKKWKLGIERRRQP